MDFFQTSKWKFGSNQVTWRYVLNSAWIVNNLFLRFVDCKLIAQFEKLVEKLSTCFGDFIPINS